MNGFNGEINFTIVYIFQLHLCNEALSARLEIQVEWKILKKKNERLARRDFEIGGHDIFNDAEYK